MCPHTTVCVSSYFCMCVLILLYVCQHTCMLLYLCLHTAIYTQVCQFVEANDWAEIQATAMCVLILLYICPHTICILLYILRCAGLWKRMIGRRSKLLLCVSSYYYIYVLILVYAQVCRFVEADDWAEIQATAMCVLILLYVCQHTSICSGVPVCGSG